MSQFWIGVAVGVSTFCVLELLMMLAAFGWVVLTRRSPGEQELERAREDIGYDEQYGTPPAPPPSQEQAPVISELNLRSRPPKRR